MKTTKIIAIVFLVLAGVAGYMRYSESHGLGSSLSSTFSGQPSDNVLIKYEVAVVSVVIGIVLLKK